MAAVIVPVALAACDLESKVHVPRREGWVPGTSQLTGQTVALIAGAGAAAVASKHRATISHRTNRRCVRRVSQAVQRDASDPPGWLPCEDELKALAAGHAPVCFYCLRAPDAESKASCACEVRGGSDSARRRFHFTAAQPTGAVASEGACGVHTCLVEELPFSEGKLGGHLWDGGIFMAIWATSWKGATAAKFDKGTTNAAGAELFAGKRVLELGSGIGLLGIALAGSVASSVVLTDFGLMPGEAAGESDRLIPPGLLGRLQENAEKNGVGSKIEVRHLDWHDFLPLSADVRAKGSVEHLLPKPEERFERLVAADVVYYASDVPALAAAAAAHLLPGGRGFFMVPEREWHGPLAAERACAADLMAALSPYGTVSATLFMGHAGTVDGKGVLLVEFQRWDADASSDV